MNFQEKFGRVIVVADAAHAFGAERKGKKCGQAADFIKLFLPCSKESYHSGRRSSHMVPD